MIKCAVESGVPLPEKGMVVFHVCQRGEILPYSNLIVRKFKSLCGNTLEVHITRKSGIIKTIIPLYSCRAGCRDCADRIEKIRALIAAENSRSN